MPAGQLGGYLAEEYGWRVITQLGWLERWRRHAAREAEAQVEQVTWVSSLPPERASAARLERLLRGHWAIENGIHRVRDVSYDEDGLPGRKIGIILASIRNAAITLLRKQAYAYIPDGWRHLSAQPDRGLRLLLEPL